MYCICVDVMDNELARMVSYFTGRSSTSHCIARLCTFGTNVLGKGAGRELNMKGVSRRNAY